MPWLAEELGDLLVGTLSPATDQFMTCHADLDTAVSAMSNGSLDLDLMQSKGTVSNRLGPDRLVNWEAF